MVFYMSLLHMRFLIEHYYQYHFFFIEADGAWIKQVIVIIIGLILAIVVLIAIIRKDGMYRMAEDYNNAAWQPVVSACCIWSINS